MLVSHLDTLLCSRQIYGESPCCDWNWNPSEEEKKNFKPFDSAGPGVCRGADPRERLTCCLLRFRIHHLCTAGQNPRSPRSDHKCQIVSVSQMWQWWNDRVEGGGWKVFDWLLGNWCERVRKACRGSKRGQNWKSDCSESTCEPNFPRVQHGNKNRRKKRSELFTHFYFFQTQKQKCDLEAQSSHCSPRGYSSS